MQIVINMIKRLRLFLHGQGRGVNIAIPKNTNVITRLRGCANNPVEPAAIQAAAKDDMTKIVNPE